MEKFGGRIRIVDILRDQNNWKRFLGWKNSVGVSVREAVRYHVSRALLCRTVALGVHIFRCPDCGCLRLVPHSCKSRFCSSCATARVRSWSRQLLSELLDVAYRHLIFTIPFQLRPLIQDNRKRLEQVLFRAAADSILALTRGQPRPLSHNAQGRRQRTRKRYLPGFQTALHSFGSDLKWNPHLHMLITAGGLSLNRRHWIDAPDKSLVSAVELATEWKLRVIAYIADAHKEQPLYCRRLQCDRRRRLKVDLLLGFIRRFSWRVRIGPGLQDPSHAVSYCARYSRRPALGETRIERYDGRHVTFRYKDYYRQGKRAYWKCPTLEFIDRLVQHIPEKYARHFRSYGLLATRNKTELLQTARKLLAQRKRARPQPLSWCHARKQAGEKHPLRCPRCAATMFYEGSIFGNHGPLARLCGLTSTQQRIPYPTYLPAP